MADATAHMLSTSDNPWNPWINFNEWNAYDMRAGHHTLAYLARIAVSSDDLSEPDQEAAVESAIEEIVSLNINGLYIKVPEPETSKS
jgi:hypothetical protein